MAKLINVLGGIYIVCGIVAGISIYLEYSGFMFIVLALSVILQGFIIGGTAICISSISQKTENLDNDIMHIKSKLDDIYKKN